MLKKILIIIIPIIFAILSVSCIYFESNYKFFEDLSIPYEISKDEFENVIIKNEENGPFFFI